MRISTIVGTILGSTLLYSVIRKYYKSKITIESPQDYLDMPGIYEKPTNAWLFERTDDW